jgi:hypothetical protein
MPASVLKEQWGDREALYTTWDSELDMMPLDKKEMDLFCTISVLLN